MISATGGVNPAVVSEGAPIPPPRRRVAESGTTLSPKESHPYFVPFDILEEFTPNKENDTTVETMEEQEGLASKVNTMDSQIGEKTEDSVRNSAAASSPQVKEARLMKQRPYSVSHIEQNPKKKEHHSSLLETEGQWNQNHVKRLKSGKCRENWILPRKSQQPEEIFTLFQLVVDHSRKFPLSGIVVNFLGDHVPIGSVINIHFIKKTCAIDINDTLNQRYLIPYNSSIKFGLIYCPDIKNESYLFEKVSDIIQASDLPKVVTCTKKHDTISQDEVLIVKEVIKAQAKSKKSKLKVFSFTDKREKILSGDVNGRFNTDPRLAQFFIPEIIQYMPESFPITARLYYDKEVETSSMDRPILPRTLTREPVMILDSTLQTSVIASLSPTLSSDIRGSVASAGITKNIVEIPVSEDITLAIIDEKMKQLSSVEALHSDTETIWKQISSDKNVIQPRLLLAGKNTVQHRLFTMVRGDGEVQGQALEVPPLIRKDLVKAGATSHGIYQMLIDGVLTNGDHPYASLLNSNAETQEDVFEEPGSEIKKKLPPPSITDYHSSTHRLVRRVEALEVKLATTVPQKVIHRLTRRIEALESRLPPTLIKSIENSSKREEELKQQVKSLQTAFKLLEDQVKKMQKEFTQVPEDDDYEHMKPGVIPQPTPEENIQTLRTMDTAQVRKLLEVLYLHQYKKTFFEENITGEILAECNEEVLIQDLGMKNQTHRNKLLTIIRGQYSPLALIDDNSASYVRFQANELS